MAAPNMRQDDRLEQALQRFYAAFNDRDIERLLALFEPDAVYVTAAGRYAGTQADIRTALQRALAQETRLVQGARKTIIAGDIALMMSNWSQACDEPDANPAGGTSTIVFRRQPDGEWRIVIDNPMGAGLL